MGRVEVEQAPSPRLEAAIGGAALAAACVSFAVLVTSDSLHYPGWSAVHEVNLILAPVAIGLYWWRRRPASRLGMLLVALGFLAVPVMLQGASNPQLHSIGVLADAPAFVMTLYILLAFPTGMLRGGADRVIVAATALLLLATYVPLLLMLNEVSGGGPLAACSDQCPNNPWFVAAHPDLTSALVRIEGYGGVVLTLATAAVLASRYLNGNRPQRRALAVGVSTGVVFCLAFAAFHLMLLWSPDHPYLSSLLQWTLVGARGGLAWGMLFALAAAEIDGGRVLRRLVAGSLQKSASRELERNLASALNDPALRLAFWEPDRGMYVDADELEVAAPGPGSGRVLTEVRRDGQRRGCDPARRAASRGPRARPGGWSRGAAHVREREARGQPGRDDRRPEGFAREAGRRERHREATPRTQPARRRAAEVHRLAHEAHQREGASAGDRASSAVSASSMAIWKALSCHCGSSRRASTRRCSPTRASDLP